MANGKSNSAEELNIAPELEVVDGEATHFDAEATVVEPEEITALLDEMAKQNEETLAALDAAPKEPVLSELEAPVSLASEVQVDSPVEEPAIENLSASDEIESSKPVEELKEAAVKTPQVGPSFTMDQILQAASSSTGFSVDEIKKFEGDELAEGSTAEIESNVEEINEEIDVLEETQAEQQPAAVTDEGKASPVEERTKAAEPSLIEDSYELETSADETLVPRAARAKRIKRIKLETPKLKVPEWVMVAAGVLVSIAGGYFLTSKQSHSLESKITAKVSRIDNSLAELTELVEGTNTRLANLDRSLSTGEPDPKRVAAVHAAQKDHEPPKAHETKAAQPAETHAPKEDPVPPKVVKNDPIRHIEAKKSPVMGDNYNSAAQTEGFQSGKIIIAGRSHSPKPSGKVHTSSPGHSKVKKLPNHNKRVVPKSKVAPGSQNSVRVYLHGKPVSLGAG